VLGGAITNPNVAVADDPVTFDHVDCKYSAFDELAKPLLNPAAGAEEK